MIFLTFDSASTSECCSSGSSVPWTDVLSIVLATINIIFIILFSIYQVKSDSKIEKHHDALKWYETFKLQENTEQLMNSADLFKSKIIQFINVSKKNANNAVQIKDDFSNELYIFKDKFLTIVEVISCDKIPELIEELEKVEEDANEILKVALTNKNIDEAKTTIDALVYKIKKNILKNASSLSSL